uniref:HECT-type E3 ubiquitin transferase n=1 Tax=Tetraselmis chuii TaxID=63592 RepID=A0A7S1SW68_9CHLO|mmetsp:Transcript_32783/g.58747  ORF Transcript_32783/g.58747 Transcript_32783/m.58747 type:complete len:498 (+) Transcript_32783:1476-2969(+)
MRRPFCAPSMWLAPYIAATEGEDSGCGTGQMTSLLLLPFGTRPPPPITDFSAPAVVRALVNRINTGESSYEVEEGGTSSQQAVRSGVSPNKLASLLLAAPHCVPFPQRVEVFRALIAADKYHNNNVPVIRLTVNRSSLLGEAYGHLAQAGPAIKARLEVTYLNAQGLQEAGLDYGGLMKDFIEDVIHDGFNPDYGLFAATREGQLHPGSQAVHMDQGPGLLEFIGMMVGKAMYEGMLVDLPLAPFFILRLQGRRPLFDDLQMLDEEIYRSLVTLKQYEGNCADLGLDFTIEEEIFGRREVVELVADGARLPVTKANRLQYVALVADWYLNGGTRGAAASAFAQGLGQVIPLSWLSLFSPKELNEVIGGGTAGELDLDDMRRHTRYSGGYSEASSPVKLFWKVLHQFSSRDRAALLKFVTSCSRAPLGGFEYMNPPFVIHKVPCPAPLMATIAGPDVDRLPSASTCYNTLKLPNFRRASTMREKLLYAIHSGAGFELS